MEGKETRFGIVSSALYATVSTSSGDGAVDAMHDSFTPLGGLVPMTLMQTGEVAFGGPGSGPYSMLMVVLLAVFVAGLVIGRAPEYVGKKIEAYGRFTVIVPVLAIAGSLAAKQRRAAGAGTLPTHGPLFLCMLLATVVLATLLTFLPALALGPIAEHLAMTAGR